MKDRPSPVIDSHLHVFARQSAEFPREVNDHLPAEREAPVERLLERMESHGVDGAVLVQIGGTSLEVHAYLLHCLREHPDRFLGIGLVPPDCEDPGAHMDRLAEASDGRVIGFRLSRLGGPADPFEPVDVRRLPVYPIWEHAARRDYVIWLYPRAVDAHVVPHLFEAFPRCGSSSTTSWSAPARSSGGTRRAAPRPTCPCRRRPATRPWA